MKTVITISRQYGSGGREIGQALAAAASGTMTAEEALNQAQSEMSAAESAIYAMSRVFAAPGRGPRALSRRPSRRRRRRP